MKIVLLLIFVGLNLTACNDAVKMQAETKAKAEAEKEAARIAAEKEATERSMKRRLGDYTAQPMDITIGPKKEQETKKEETAKDNSPKPDQVQP